MPRTSKETERNNSWMSKGSHIWHDFAQISDGTRLTPKKQGKTSLFLSAPWAFAPQIHPCHLDGETASFWLPCKHSVGAKFPNWWMVKISKFHDTPMICSVSYLQSCFIGMFPSPTCTRCITEGLPQWQVNTWPREVELAGTHFNFHLKTPL